MTAAPRVLLAVEQLRRSVPGGIGTYAAGVLKGLRDLAGEGDEVPDVTLYASRPGARPDPLRAFGCPVRASVLPGPLLTRAWDLGLVTAPGGFDVVHSVSLAAPPPHRGGGAGVVAVHDLAWRRADAYPRRGRRWHEAALARALHRARAFVVPAPAVAEELVAAGADDRRVRLIPYGCDHLAPPDDAAADAVLARLGVTGPFVMSVGTLEPRKNLTRLLDAFERARRWFPEPWPLVVVGPAGWGPGLEARTGVALAGEVDARTLSALYGRARVLAYVPIEEGFGLPVVEAMALGTPVVASPVPSTGGAAYEVDPVDADAIAAGLVAVATDEQLRVSLEAQGRARSAQLTWAASVRSLVELWSSLA